VVDLIATVHHRVEDGAAPPVHPPLQFLVGDRPRASVVGGLPSEPRAVLGHDPVGVAGVDDQDRAAGGE
jgi:hypothetical protein